MYASVFDTGHTVSAVCLPNPANAANLIAMSDSSRLKAQLARLRAAALQTAREEGVNKSSVEFLSAVRRSRSSAPAVSTLNPAFCLVLQGAKVVSMGKLLIRCTPGNFLASAIEMPALVHIEDATPERPYIGLIVHFSTEEIASLVVESGFLPRPPGGADPRDYVGEPCFEFLDVLERIMALDSSPEDQFRAKLLKRELAFCLLSGPYGHLFAPKAAFDPASGILRAISWIRSNFEDRLCVEDLADMTHMSVSSLYHKFKAATSMSPVQFQKILRLQEARCLLLSGSYDVTSTAYQVGYESLSHFAREYHRLFECTPGSDAKRIPRLHGSHDFDAASPLEWNAV
ncbi:MAG TPA: AraC family transcriptional regulator [Spirochaetia bacterium]